MGITDGPQRLGSTQQIPRQVLQAAGSPGDAPFQAASLLVPRPSIRAKYEAVLRPPEPRFIPPKDFYRFTWTDQFCESFSSRPLLKNIPVTLFREVPALPHRFAARPLVASLSFHLLAVPLVFAVLQIMPTGVSREDSHRFSRDDVIYYHISQLTPLERLPKIMPSGTGSSPGSGIPQPEALTKGATVNHRIFSAVSRPRIPDNHHQTILQPNTPADLKLKDISLPNLVGAQREPAKPRAEYLSSAPRPLRPKVKAMNADALKLPEVLSSQTPQGVAAMVPATPARLAAPIGNLSAPMVRSAGESSTQASAPPTFDATTENAQGPSVMGTANRRVPVPLNAVAGRPTLPASGTRPAGAGPDPPVDVRAPNGQGLVALSTDPGSAAETVAIPAGNRYGEFSISSSARGAASPGGEEETSRNGGGAAGAGGNEGTGAGHDPHGVGGGADRGASGFISLRGDTENEAMLADPPPALAQMVYALPAPALLRHNTLVVSAGPIGGGGSNVYGKLPCGKIYTVFLPTGGRQWSLQFCQKSEGPASSENKARTAVVRAELPIIPPEPQQSYDFKRLPLPPERVYRSIILRGAINEDGVVEDLEIHEGVLPTMDAAARLAFSQWKFKPAIRSGKPVRVEILVAIPMEQPKSN